MTLIESRPPVPHSAVPHSAVAAPTPVHEAQVLTHGGATAQILLNGQTYILRITRQGKLILTK
jgi:hemin uptake protein HemP